MSEPTDASDVIGFWFGLFGGLVIGVCIGAIWMIWLHAPLRRGFGPRP